MRWRAGKDRRSKSRYTVITLVEGEGEGLQFTVDRTAKEVEEARRSCAEGRPNKVALSIVLAFLQFCGAPCADRHLADEELWPAADIVALFAMLGMPLLSWSDADDAALERLLAEGVRPGGE